MKDGGVDVLAIGAHPDDVELGVGGTVCKLVRQGYRVGILDLTQGEMATRGSVDERRAEAREAASQLGVTIRENAGLPDGAVANSDAMRRTLIKLLRTFRARVIIAPMERDRHPDHDAAHALVRDSNYLAGLARVDDGQEPHRAKTVYFYRVYGDATAPQLVVDISETYESKEAALRAYRSQLYNPTYAGDPTYVSSEAFWNSIAVRAAYWGARIGAAYGEPLYCEGPVPLQTVPGLEQTP